MFTTNFSIVRECINCLETKPLSEFNKRSKNSETYQSMCRVCDNLKARERYHKNRTKYRKRQRNSTLIRRYGISAKDYEVMLKSQNGKCKLCGSENPRKGAKNLIVDHCHSTGNVRGLLCNPCNVLLGKLNDDIEYIDRIRQYLIDGQNQ